MLGVSLLFRGLRLFIFCRSRLILLDFFLLIPFSLIACFCFFLWLLLRIRFSLWIAGFLFLSRFRWTDFAVFIFCLRILILRLRFGKSIFVRIVAFVFNSECLFLLTI